MTHGVDALNICGLEYSESWSLGQRRFQEKQWIIRLGIKYPGGLNHSLFCLNRSQNPTNILTSLDNEMVTHIKHRVGDIYRDTSIPVLLAFGPLIGS